MALCAVESGEGCARLSPDWNPEARGPDGLYMYLTMAFAHVGAINMKDKRRIFRHMRLHTPSGPNVFHPTMSVTHAVFSTFSVIRSDEARKKRGRTADQGNESESDQEELSDCDFDLGDEDDDMEDGCDDDHTPHDVVAAANPATAAAGPTRGVVPPEFNPPQVLWGDM
jgi:hypothetical protein